MAAAAGADKKKKIFIAAGIGIVLVVALILIFTLKGGKKEEDSASSPAGGAPRAGSRGGGMGGVLARGGGSSAATGSEATAARAAEAPAAPAATHYPGEKEEIRPDPFVLQIPPKPVKPPTPPPPPALPAIALTEGGIRVQRTTGPATTLRRTAGLLFNDQVYGLLQLGDSTYIVRPGDTVQEYVVSAITRDAIVLYSPVLRKQIQVPLQGPHMRMPEQIGESPVTEGFGFNTSMPVSGFGSEEGEWTEEIIPALPALPPQ
jgi:hypothetical protein